MGLRAGEQGQTAGEFGGTSQPLPRRARSWAAGSGSVHGPRGSDGPLAGAAAGASLENRTLMNTSSLITCAVVSKTSRSSGSLVASSSQNLAARLPFSRQASTIWAVRLSAEPAPAYTTT